MMNLDQWYAREDLQAQLSEDLKRPAILAALEVLVKVGLPAPQAVPAGASLTEHGALLNARREGYYEFYHNLLKLTAKPAAPRTAPKAWQGPHVERNL